MEISKKQPYTLDRVVRLVIGVAVGWAALLLLDKLSAVLIPFVIALILAYILSPVVKGIQRLVKKRAVAVLITMSILIAIVTTATVLIIPRLVREVAETVEIVSRSIGRSRLAEFVSESIPEKLWLSLQEWRRSQDVQDLLSADNISAIYRIVGQRIVPGMWNLLSGTLAILWGVLGLAVILLYLVFLLLDFESIQRGWAHLIPPSYRARVVSVVRDFDASMSTYFRGQSMVALTVGILFAVGFEIIGLPMGIFLGLFAGLLNMVPYMQFVALIPAFFLAFVSGLAEGAATTPGMMLVKALLVFLLVQGTQDLVLVPLIVGKATGLNPALMILSLSIWGSLLGFFGLLIAIPFTCLLIAYYSRFIQRQEDIAGIDHGKFPLTGRSG